MSKVEEIRAAKERVKALELELESLVRRKKSADQIQAAKDRLEAAKAAIE